MIVEIQCLPRPSGTDEEPYAFVKAAIARVSEADVRFEVGPLGTTLEGPPASVWPLLRRIHEASLEAGARSVISIVKVAQWADEAAAPTMDSLTDGYR